MSKSRKPHIDEEDAATQVYDPAAATREVATKDMPTKDMPTRPANPLPPKPPTPSAVGHSRPRSQPLNTPQPLPAPPMKAVSMKTPAEIAAEKKKAMPQRPGRPAIPQVQIRSIAESTRHRAMTPPQGLGTLAPPRDPKQARERQIWSLVFWGSIVVIIASLVALVVWLILR